MESRFELNVVHDARPQMADGVVDAQWIAKRVGYWSASRAADLIGKLRNGQPSQKSLDYRLEKFTERACGRAVDHYQTEAMQRGLMLEEEAADAYAEAEGVILEPGGWWHDDAHLVACTPDRLLSEEDGFMVVEFKCPWNQLKHAALLAGGEPDPAYVTQVRFQMWVTGAHAGILVDYDPRWPEPLQLWSAPVEQDAAAVEAFEAAVEEGNAWIASALEALK